MIIVMHLLLYQETQDLYTFMLTKVMFGIKLLVKESENLKDKYSLEILFCQKINKI